MTELMTTKEFLDALRPLMVMEKDPYAELTAQLYRVEKGPPGEPNEMGGFGFKITVHGNTYGGYWPMAPWMLPDK